VGQKLGHGIENIGKILARENLTKLYMGEKR